MYEYLKFETVNLEDSQITNAELSFAVSKSWVNENGIDKYSIKLNRYTTLWEELNTGLIDENEENYYYTAQSTGFSYYAITGKNITETLTEEQLIEETQTSNLKIIIYSVLAVILILGLILFLIHEFKNNNV